MKVSLKIDGDLAGIAGAWVAEGERAVTRAMALAGAGLKSDWRAQIEAAGLGPRLARTIRNETYPKGTTSLRAAALVWSKAGPIVDAFERGALIRARDGFWLAIPLPAAGKKGPGNSRITPGGWEQRTGLRLRFVYRRGRPSLLVAETRLSSKGRAEVSRSKTGRGVATVPIFVLVPQVRLQKRLKLGAAATAWQAQVPGLIVENWVEGMIG